MKKQLLSKNITLGFILAIILSIITYVIGYNDIKEKAYLSFKEDSDISRKDIVSEFDKYSRFLNGLKAFVLTHPQLTENKLNQYFDAVNVDKSYSSLIYLGYTQWLNDKRISEVYYFNKQIYQAPEHNPNYYINSRKISLQTDKDGRIFWALEYRIPLTVNGQAKEIVSIINFDEIIEHSLSQNFKSNKLHYMLMEEGKQHAFFKKRFLFFEIKLDNFLDHFDIDINGDKYSILLYVKDLNKYNSGEGIILFLSIIVGVLFISLWLLYNRLWSAKSIAGAIAAKATEDLTKLAWYDSLTGLYNRGKCLNNIENFIEKNKDKSFYLFFIDLDGFKRVNDTLGHHAGDIILSEYAKRLKSVIPKEHMLARVGGDEFVVLIEKKYTDEQKIKYWVDIIKEITSELFIIDNYKFALSQSIGLAMYPEHGLDSESLLKKADIAMYIAKKSDSQKYCIYTEKVGNELIERNKMEGNLIEAIKNNELYLMYQPKMHKGPDGYELIGIETLMRWNSPIWGEVGPDRFIPIAEQNGFIDEMSNWLLKTVCEKIKDWESNYGVTIPVSINLSGKQFLNPSLADELLAIIGHYKVDTSCIIIEITESTIMKQPEIAKKIIGVLRYYGVKVSMDDFGTGYSSFSYLSSFMLDELKIDKSFIRKTKKSNLDKSVVEAIVTMAHKLKLNVIAEGVETIDEIEFLTSIDCLNYQGYYFSRPLKEKDFLDFYERHKSKNKKKEMLSNECSS